MDEAKLCEYGCGQEAKHQLKNGRWCCENSQNKCPSVRKKNSEKRKQQYRDGLTNSNLLNYIKSPNYKVWNKGLTKETDDRVKQTSNTLIENHLSGKTPIKRHPHTKESRDKLSKARSENLKKLGGGGFLTIKWYYTKNILGQEYVNRGSWEVLYLKS